MRTHIIIMLSALTFLAGCFDGPTGPAGEQGIQGEQGIPGESFETEIFIGQFTEDWKSQSGNWVIHIQPAETLTEDVAGVMVFVGSGEGAWIRSPLWGYAATPDLISITVFNSTADGEIPAGWWYKVVVFKAEG
jgi:hypothetical protein